VTDPLDMLPPGNVGHVQKSLPASTINQSLKPLLIDVLAAWIQQRGKTARNPRKSLQMDAGSAMVIAPYFQGVMAMLSSSKRSAYAFMPINSHRLPFH
jgi:hypothetical protein